MSGSTILSLDIHADRIGLAMASNPSALSLKKNRPDSSDNNKSYYPLESIRLSSKNKKVPAEAKQRLAEIVKEYKVCGFVVSWPLQRDTGRMGASCGRTLYTLEQLLDDPSIINTNRPLCLWDSQHVQATQVDAFGRSPVFARTSTKQQHLASKEQYHQDESIVATQVWEDFCQQYWPNEVAAAGEEKISEEKVAAIATTATRTKKPRPSLFDSNRTTTSSSTWQQRRRRALVAAA
jgi:RNase H-fold protein (predicted Holliday junction resolvase)